MKRSICIILAVPTIALAQQPQRPSDDELNAMFQAITQQRNVAQDQIAQLAAKMSVLEKSLKEALAKECKPDTKKDDAKK